MATKRTRIRRPILLVGPLIHGRNPNDLWVRCSPEKRAIILKDISFYESMHREGSASAAWRAYKLCRGYQAPIPEWVLKVFDEVADGFQIGSARGDIKPILKSLGLALGRGSTSPFEREALHELDHDLAVRMRVLVDGEHLNETNAKMLVARARGVSEPTVLRAWKRLKHLARRDDLNIQQQMVALADQTEEYRKSHPGWTGILDNVAK